MLKIKQRFNYKQENEVVNDTTSKTRPDTWRSVSEWVERLADFSDIYVDDSEDIIEDKIDTAYQDKLELAQIAHDIDESVSLRPASSSSAEQKKAEDTPKADEDDEIKSSSTDDKSSND